MLSVIYADSHITGMSQINPLCCVILMNAIMLSVILMNTIMLSVVVLQQPSITHYDTQYNSTQHNKNAQLSITTLSVTINVPLSITLC
jgi:hypothetical protein